MDKLKGFSLLELLITLAIVAILMAVAVPSYHQYIVRSYLTEAFDSLAAYRIRLEQAYQDNGNYATNGACSVAVPSTKTFNFSCAIADGGQSFTVTATGNGVKGVTQDYVYTLNNVGEQVTTNFPGATTLPAACWLTKAGDC